MAESDTSSSLDSSSDEGSPLRQNVQPTEAIDLTSSPEPREPDAAARTMSPDTANFFRALHDLHRPEFMIDLRAQLAKVKRDQNVAEVLHAQHEANLLHQIEMLNEKKRELSQQRYHRASYVTKRDNIIALEGVLVAERELNDRIRSWKGYVLELVTTTEGLVELWEKIFDWYENDLRRVAEAANSGREAEILYLTLQPVELYKALRMVEARMELAKAGALTHGSRVTAMINGQ